MQKRLYFGYIFNDLTKRPKTSKSMHFAFYENTRNLLIFINSVFFK